MKDFNIITRGHNSKEFNLICTKHNAYSINPISYEEVAVPGRDCPFIRSSDTRARFNLEAEVFLNSTDILSDSIKIRNWLAQDLEDLKIELTNVPGYYLKGFLGNKLDISEIINQTGHATLIFNCQPYLFKNDGDSYVTVISSSSTTSATITNPGNVCKPLIKITCTPNSSNEVAFTINNQEVLIKYTGGQSYTFYIDCNLMDMYSYGASNDIILENSKMYSDFPVLESGTNRITVTKGTISKFEIMPRWRV